MLFRSSENMLVLQENPAHNAFTDATELLRNVKLNAVYGYYSDGWMDEQAELRFRMAGGKLQANGRMAILAGKVDFSDSAELIAKKTLAVVSVKKALIGGGSTFMMPAMEAGKDNTLHLGNTKITRHDGSHAFLAGGNVYLDSAQMDDKQRDRKSVV